MSAREQRSESVSIEPEGVADAGEEGAGQASLFFSFGVGEMMTDDDVVRCLSKRRELLQKMRFFFIKKKARGVKPRPPFHQPSTWFHFIHFRLFFFVCLFFCCFLAAAAVPPRPGVKLSSDKKNRCQSEKKEAFFHHGSLTRVGNDPRGSRWLWMSRMQSGEDSIDGKKKK